MSVLTLAGAPINWDKPPKATDLVAWSRLGTNGKKIIGSLRTIAHLDRLDALALARFGVHISVIQGPYSTSVPTSAGTHDFDACLDVWIPGVDGLAQQKFFRENGAGAYLRTPAQGFSLHIHYFTLPPREGTDVNDDFRSAGFRVGKYVDGGWSTVGRSIASSQIWDYYNRKTALSGHAHDPTWFPADIGATVFDLPAYILRRQREGRLTVQTVNVEKMSKPPLGRSLVSGNPDVVVLQQAENAGEHLRSFDGYRLIERKRGEEARSIKTMVRLGSATGKVKWLRTFLAWVGPKAGRRHLGRTFLAVRVTKPFHCWVVDVHFPTGGPDGPNAQAWAEAWDKVVAFSKRRKRVVVIGDFNATAAQLVAMARKEGFDLVNLGKVDHALSKGVKSTSVQQYLPGTPNGVHGWGAVTYKKEQ